MAPGFDQNNPASYSQRWAALKNLPAFMRLVWQASPGMMLLMVALRVARALFPVAMLWVGKLIIDQVVLLLGQENAPSGLSEWWQAGLLNHLSWLVLAELSLALLSDLLGRGVNYTNSLMQEKLVISLSVRVMDHAAELDLEDFEDAAFQDRLDRARRITVGNVPLLNQVMSSPGSRYCSIRSAVAATLRMV